MAFGDPWFAPKAIGFGAGLPIAWQGWAMLAVHIGAIAAAVHFAPQAFGHRPLAAVGAPLLITLAMLPIYAAKTEGGWHWRSGR